jgi:hypothetical protein
LFRTYVVCPQTQYIKPSSQIRTHDVQDFFDLLNCRYTDLPLDHLVELRKQGAFEEGEETEPKERTMTGLKLTERLRVTEGGIRVFRTVIRASSEQQQLDKEL